MPQPPRAPHPTRRLLLSALTLSALVLLLAACAPEAQQADADTLEVDSTLARDAAAVERIVYAMPSAPQVLTLLKQAGATYDGRLLNPPRSAARYTTTEKAALNIGIYSTDLAVAAAFDQSQESVNYFIAIQQLADRLGVASAFDETVITRLDKNRDRADSINAIVTGAFDQANRKLKKFGQDDIGRLILVGGWAEGLHLATAYHTAKPSKMMAERIAEQKLVLDNLLSIVAQDSARASFAQVYPRLRRLQTAFAAITIDYSYTGVSSDPAKKITRIDNSSEVRVTPEQLADITRQARELRTLIIQ